MTGPSDGQITSALIQMHHNHIRRQLPWIRHVAVTNYIQDGSSITIINQYCIKQVESYNLLDIVGMAIAEYLATCKCLKL